MKTSKSERQLEVDEAQSPSSNANISGRELIWRAADGAEKRLMLPIEMIKEDIMDDPERLLDNLSPGLVPNEADDEERAKILSALQEMQSNMRNEKSVINQVHAGGRTLDDSALVIDKSIYIGDGDQSPTMNETSISGSVVEAGSPGYPQINSRNNLNETARTEDSEATTPGLASKSLTQPKLQANKGKGRKQGGSTVPKQQASFGKGKKGKGSNRKNQSEMQTLKPLGEADGILETEENETEQNGGNVLMTEDAEDEEEE